MIQTAGNWVPRIYEELRARVWTPLHVPPLGLSVLLCKGKALNLLSMPLPARAAQVFLPLPPMLVFPGYLQQTFLAH